MWKRKRRATNNFLSFNSSMFRSRGQRVAVPDGSHYDPCRASAVPSCRQLPPPGPRLQDKYRLPIAQSTPRTAAHQAPRMRARTCHEGNPVAQRQVPARPLQLSLPPQSDPHPAAGTRQDRRKCNHQHFRQIMLRGAYTQVLQVPKRVLQTQRLVFVVHSRLVANPRINASWPTSKVSANSYHKLRGYENCADYYDLVQ